MIEKPQWKPSDRQIPTAEDWAGYEDDLDAQYAHKISFGKSNDEMQEMYSDGRGGNRAEDLTFMPRAAFQYYVYAYVQFLLSDAVREGPDAASSFLSLLINRTQLDSQSVLELFDELAPIGKYVANNQSYYDADIEIYGRFEDRERKWLEMCLQYRG